jgi:hypothetical protein
MENQEQHYCACCATTYQLDDSFCNTCGYPFKGNKDEQDAYIANRAVKEIDLVDLNKKVTTATNSLYWIGGLLAFWTLISFFIMQDNPDFFGAAITNVILVVAFFAFAIWSKTKPTAALISGLSLYVILIILNAVEDPATLAQGIIFKVFIIGYLIKGIMAVIEVEKIKKELNIK